LYLNFNYIFFKCRNFSQNQTYPLTFNSEQKVLFHIAAPTINRHSRLDYHIILFIEIITFWA